MAGGGFIAAAGGAGSPEGAALAAWASTAARVGGDMPERRSPSSRENNASPSANAATANAPKSISLVTVAPMERAASLTDNHDNMMSERLDKIPDIRDGLTREERVVLYVLHETQRERGDRNVPTVMLWGRVCEHFYISPEDLSLMLARLGARK